MICHYFTRVIVFFTSFSGVEDDDKISEVIKGSGQLHAKFSDLSYINGKVRIDVEQSFMGDVAILMGGTNKFEHYLANRNREQFTLKVPNGNFEKIFLPQ